MTDIDNIIRGGLDNFTSYLDDIQIDVDSNIIDISTYNDSIASRQELIIKDILDSISDKININEYVSTHKDISLQFDALKDNYIKHDISVDTAYNKINTYMKEFDSQFKNVVKTGFPTFDNELGGISTGLTTIGAISSLGKSTLCLQLADQVAMADNKVIYYTAEMSEKDLFVKSIIRLSERHRQLSYWDIVNIRECTNISKTESFLNSIEDYKVYSKNITIKTVSKGWEQHIRDDIKATIKINEGKSPVIIIDYLQILPALSTTANKGSEYSVLNDIVAELKKIIQEFNCSIICISSLGRDSYAKQVTLSSFKGSGSIEYSSEMVLALDPNILDSYQGESIYNDKQKEYDMDVLNQWKKKAEKILDLRVLKNRNGRSGDTFNLLFQSSKFKFSEIV